MCSKLRFKLRSNIMRIQKKIVKLLRGKKDCLHFAEIFETFNFQFKFGAKNSYNTTLSLLKTKVSHKLNLKLSGVPSLDNQTNKHVNRLERRFVNRYRLSHVPKRLSFVYYSETTSPVSFISYLLNHSPPPLH